MAQPRAMMDSRWLVGAVVFAACYWVLDLAVLRAGVPHPLDDLWEDGLVARGLLADQWFRSPVFYPPLWELRDPTTLTVPVLIHGPILPLLLVPPIKFLGPQVLDQMAWLAAGFAFLTAVPLFRIAARYFDGPVGAAAVFLFTVSPLTLVAVHHYASVVLGALLLTIAFELLARERPRPVAAGLTYGITYLVRPEMLLGAPVLAVLAGRSGTSFVRGSLGFLVAFAATASWWWWHHWQAVGSPLFNLSSYILVCFSPAHPGDSLFRDFTATPDRWGAILNAALPHLWPKWVEFSLHAAKNVAFTPTGATGWLMVPGLMVAFGRPEHRRVAVSALLLALIPVAAMTLFVHIKHYLVPFLPFYALAAVLGARRMFERLPEWAHRPRAWIGGLALLVLPSVGPALGEGAREGPLAVRLLADERRALAGLRATPATAGRVLFTDRLDFTAWTTGRPTLVLKVEDYERLYPAAGPAETERPFGLPRRREVADTWFHRGHWARGERAAQGSP